MRAITIPFDHQEPDFLLFARNNPHASREIMNIDLKPNGLDKVRLSGVVQSPATPLCAPGIPRFMTDRLLSNGLLKNYGTQSGGHRDAEKKDNTVEWGNFNHKTRF